MECRLCRERVVICFDAIHGQLDLEIAFENEVFKIQRFAVFLDGLRPLGLSEVDSLCGYFDG